MTNNLEMSKFMVNGNGRLAQAQRAALNPEYNLALRQFNERERASRALAERGRRLLDEARQAYDARRDFRERRMRSRNYYRNKPNEKIRHPDTGQIVTEEEYIRSQGRFPYRMDQTSGVVGNLVGQFEGYKTQRMAFARNSDDNDVARMGTEMLKHSNQINQTDIIDSSAFEENLISGMYGWKVGHRWRHQTKRTDTTIDPVDPMTMFFSTNVADRRLFDMNMVGELNDFTMDEMIYYFARNRYEADWIRKKYTNRGYDPTYPSGSPTGFELRDNMDFYQSADPTACRVIEVWKMEWDWRNFLHDRARGTYEESDMKENEVAELNMRRYLEALKLGPGSPEMVELVQQYEPIWTCYYLTPDGDVLLARRTPYWHEQHPYSLGFGYFFDGEIWGLVEKIIDPQRLVNRITMAIDYMFGASAKGVLLVDEAMIPDRMTPEEFADEYVKFNGMILYKGKPGAKAPQQITANAIPAGMFTWLGSMMQQIKDVSGVHGAAMGNEAPGNTPAALYQQQIAQTQVTTRSLLNNFANVRKQRDLRVLQVNSQFYGERMTIPIEKQPDGMQTMVWDPTRVRDIEWDLSVADAPDTPVTRQLMENELSQHLQSNRISFSQYLQASSSPYSDVILNLIKKTNPMLKEMEMNPEGAIELEKQFRQIAASGDRDAMAYVSQLS